MMRARAPVWRWSGTWLATLLAGCAGPHHMLDSSGPQAAAIERLWWLMAVACTLVFLAVMVALAGAFARRQRAADTEEAPPLSLARSYRVIAASLVATAVVLFVFLGASIATDRKLFALEAKPARLIRVTGKQWWWSVRYEDAQPGNVFETANEIRIPVGQPVQLELKSDDVIHSLWVPSLHGKKDLIPGRDNRLWLQADRPGEFEGQCAEFCGHQHAHMRLLIVAEEPEKFETWLQRQRAPASEPQTDGQKRGRDVFLQQSCLMCHTVRGTIAGSRAGPDLTHLATRRTLGAASLRNSRENLASWILRPQALKPGAKMPDQDLTADELEALLDYLTNLQ